MMVSCHNRTEIKTISKLKIKAPEHYPCAHGHIPEITIKVYAQHPFCTAPARRQPEALAKVPRPPTHLPLLGLLQEALLAPVPSSGTESVFSFSF